MIPGQIDKDHNERLTRRDAIALLGAAAVASQMGCAPEQTSEVSSGAALQDPLIFSSAVALAAAIREGSLSSVELVQACLDRIEEVNPALNAVVQLRAEKALAEARAADQATARGESNGPLHGVPMTLKDSIDTAGLITTAGTKGRADFVPSEDATVAARLKGAGAILLGKTNTPELTLSFDTDNLVYGRTNNPYDLEKSPGGSSGGAAAIVAAGGSPFDIGSDTGGSIRVPSHFCGVAGIKPTAHRVPRTGHIISYDGFIESLTQLGPIARRIEDLSLILPIISGGDWRDPHIVDMPLGDPAAVETSGLRVAWHTDNGIYAATDETQAIVRAAASTLDGAGISVAEDRPRALEELAPRWLEVLLWTPDGGAWIERALARWGTTEPHPELKHEIEQAQPVTSARLIELTEELDAFRSSMLGFLEDYDAILCPACAFPALPHGSRPDSDMLAGFSYTIVYNYTGWPGAVVRFGTSTDGLPIGVQVVARPWREDVALALAGILESAGGFQPPTL